MKKSNPLRTRRAFLRSAALGATAAGVFPRLLAAPPPETAPDGPAGAPANEGGLIDLHSHWFSPGAIEFLSKRAKSPRFVKNAQGAWLIERTPALAGAAPSGGFPIGTHWFDIDTRLQHLAAHGVAHQLISWPTTLGVDPTLEAGEARALWTLYNDELSGVIARHGDRLSGVATLATVDPAWSAQELARAHEKLGLIGGVLPVNVFATLEGAKHFAPVFAAAQKYKSHIYLHTGYGHASIPGQPPVIGHKDSAAQRGALDWACQFAAATITFAFSGFLDAYPDVTVQIAQLGGAGAIGLVAEQVQLGARRHGIADVKAKFRNLYLDTGALGHGPEAVALSARVLGAGRIVFGTDYAPQTSVAPVIEHLNASPLTAAERAAIFRDNARALLAAKGVAV